MKSDTLKYKEGGVYINIDYECLQSIENIINSCKFFAGLSSTLVLTVFLRRTHELLYFDDHHLKIK